MGKKGKQKKTPVVETASPDGGASRGPVEAAGMARQLEDPSYAMRLQKMSDGKKKVDAQTAERARRKQRHEDKHGERHESSQQSREADIETMKEKEKVRKKKDTAMATETPPYGLGAVGGATYNPKSQSLLDVLCEDFKQMNNVAMKKPKALPKKVADKINATAKILCSDYREKRKDESLGDRKKVQKIPVPPSKNPELDALNADVKALGQSFMEQHQCFVFKLYDYLFKCFGLQENASSVPSGGGEYYDDFMGQAVLSFCALYGDLWRIQFDTFDETLFKFDCFILYCATMPVERDIFFFYNYLMRVAVIFEMALYCFDHNTDYFLIAKRCTYQFVDFLYFRDEGGWPALKAAAAVIAIATRPLRFVINCPKINVGSFADVIGALEKFKSEGAINITKKEFSLLKAMDEKFKLLPPDGNVGLQWKHLKAMLMDYFRDCMPKETTITLNTSDFHLDNFIIILDYLVDETEFYQMWLENYKPSGKKVPETIPEAFLCERKRISLRCMWEDIQILRAVRKRSRQKIAAKSCALAREQGTCVRMKPIDRLEQSFPEWKLKTKNVPSSRRFVPFRKAYADKLIELYQLVLPSFITNYCLQCSFPDSESKSSDSKRPTIVLIRESYYNQRKLDLLFSDGFHARTCGGIVINDDYLKGEIKTHSLRLVPMDVETLLDSYIREHDAGQLLPEVEVRTFAVPKIREFGSCTIWYVMGPLEKVHNSLPEALHAIENIREMVYERWTEIIEKADTDEMTVEKFRLETNTAYRMPAPVSTTEVVPEKPSEARPVDPETCSSRKKNREKKSNK